MSNTVLIVDEVHQILLETLDKRGVTYTYLPKISLPEAKAIISDYSGIIIRIAFYVISSIVKHLHQTIKT